MADKPVHIGLYKYYKFAPWCRRQKRLSVAWLHIFDADNQSGVLTLCGAWADLRDLQNEKLLQENPHALCCPKCVRCHEAMINMKGIPCAVKDSMQ